MYFLPLGTVATSFGAWSVKPNLLSWPSHPSTPSPAAPWLARVKLKSKMMVTMVFIILIEW